MAGTNQRDAACWRPRDHPNARRLAGNVRGRSVILHHKREIRIPLLRRHRKLDTRKVAQAASPPADFAPRFSVPAFHTTGERLKANMARWKVSDREIGPD